MNRTYKMLAGTTLLLVLAACGKDSYYIAEDPNTAPINNPGLGTISPAGSSDSDIRNASIFLTDASGEVFHVTSGQPNELEAGNYQVVVTAPRTGTVIGDFKQLTISGTTASLTPDVNGLLPSAPAFDAGVGTLSVSKYKETELSVPLHPMTREVAFEALIKGAEISELEPLTITLSGVSASVNLSKGFPQSVPTNRSSATETNYHINTTLSADNSSTLLKGTARLLGINGQQKVVITGTRPDGTHPIFEIDATNLLATFNTGEASTPHRLAMELTYDTEAGLTGNIHPWAPGWESDVTN